MDIKEISNGLRCLASNNEIRSKAAILRDVFDDVENAIAAGVSYDLIIDELAKHGLNITTATFKSSMSRIRRKRKVAGTVFQLTANSITEKVDLGEENSNNSVKKLFNKSKLVKIKNTVPDLDAFERISEGEKL